MRSIQSGVDDLHVVVEQQQVLALAVHGADVDLRREVERPVEADQAQAVAGDLAAARRAPPASVESSATTTIS